MVNSPNGCIFVEALCVYMLPDICAQCWCYLLLPSLKAGCRWLLEGQAVLPPLIYFAFYDDPISHATNVIEAKKVA